MYASMSYYDWCVLPGYGFTYGLTDEIMHGTDKTGQEWQVMKSDDGKFITFSPFPDLFVPMEPHRRMQRAEFHSLFTSSF